MTAQPSQTTNPAKWVVRQDLRAVREMLRRVKASARLADLSLFGRRNPARMVDYLDRRYHERDPIEMPIYVLPVAYDGRHAQRIEGAAAEQSAMTRDVSLRGIGFLHHQPLEQNYLIATVDLLDGDPASLLLEIRWSNVERTRRYMSGGRFLGVTDVLEL